LVRQDGGRLAQIAGRTRCKLPRCAHQLASAYHFSLIVLGLIAILTIALLLRG
jgi:hypothetical protein